jgi:ATP-dependent DNA helicase RecG
LYLEKESKSREEIMKAIGVKNYTKSVRRSIEPLEVGGVLARTIPDKPPSPKQRYYLTEKGKSLILVGPSK